MNYGNVHNCDENFFFGLQRYTFLFEKDCFHINTVGTLIYFIMCT